jgi:hypothetical protein
MDSGNLADDKSGLMPLQALQSFQAALPHIAGYVCGRLQTNPTALGLHLELALHCTDKGSAVAIHAKWRDDPTQEQTDAVREAVKQFLKVKIEIIDQIPKSKIEPYDFKHLLTDGPKVPPPGKLN